MSWLVVTTGNAHLLEKGDIVMLSGPEGESEWKVTDLGGECSLTVRNAYWWESLWFELLSWMATWDRRFAERYF